MYLSYGPTHSYRKHLACNEHVLSGWRWYTLSKVSHMKFRLWKPFNSYYIWVATPLHYCVSRHTLKHSCCHIVCGLAWCLLFGGYVCNDLGSWVFPWLGIESYRLVLEYLLFWVGGFVFLMFRAVTSCDLHLYCGDLVFSRCFLFFCVCMGLFVLVLVDCDLDDCGLCRDRLGAEVVWCVFSGIFSSCHFHFDSYLLVWADRTLCYPRGVSRLMC